MRIAIVFFSMFILSIFTPSSAFSDQDDVVFFSNSQIWSAMPECHASLAPPLLTTHSQPVYDGCRYYWVFHPRNRNIAHITTLFNDDGKNRPTRIDILDDGGGLIIVHRHCRWNYRGDVPLGNRISRMEIYVRGGEVELRDCDRNIIELPRPVAIGMVLERIRHARNEEPPFVAKYLDDLRREHARAVN